ncbi:MAG: ADP-ribosylation factor-like protein [Promethearchaeia archaeon]
MENMKSAEKICLIGESGVGKTSLLRLLQGKQVSTERNPTVGLEIENSKLDGKKCAIWDLGGQERFKFMWEDFLRGSGLTVLVCDSTEKNIKKTKKIYQRFLRRNGSKVIAIANKQDLPKAMKVDKVQEKLDGLPTYGMSAIRSDLRDRLRDILEYEAVNKE